MTRKSGERDWSNDLEKLKRRWFRRMRQAMATLAAEQEQAVAQLDKEAFITEVQRRKALWESHRRNAVFERQLWAEVARRFHVPVSVCRGLWKEIKTAFIADLHRCKRDGIIYSCVWASRLRFLLGETFIGREIGELLNWKFFNVVPTWAGNPHDWRNKARFEWVDVGSCSATSSDVCPHCFNRLSLPPQWYVGRTPPIQLPPPDSSFVPMYPNVPYPGPFLFPQPNYAYSPSIGLMYADANETNAITQRADGEQENNTP